MVADSEKNVENESPAADVPPLPAPMPDNIRGIQPGGGTIQSLELAWGRLRRALLKKLRPAYVRRMASRLHGDSSTCPVEVIDSRDLKYFRNVCDCWFESEDDRFRWRDRLPFARAGFAELMLFGGGALIVTIALALGVAGSAWWSVLPASGVAFVTYFFRDPERTIPAEPGVVVSPADGKIVDISEIDDAPHVGEPALRIGIFLSVFNCHVNRAALAGSVCRLEYLPGKFINALYERSAEENERMVIDLVETAPPYRKYVIRQIAGAIARRIVCELRPGQEVETGERIGMIKFGSRTELLLPKEGLETLVKVGDKVYGGATRLGRYRPREEEV